MDIKNYFKDSTNFDDLQLNFEKKSQKIISYKLIQKKKKFLKKVLPFSGEVCYTESALKGEPPNGRADKDTGGGAPALCKH